MVYFNQQIERLGKALGIRRASSAVLAGASTVHPVAVVQDTVVEHTSSFRTSVTGTNGALTIVGE
jgi:hypothetical protein